jgi:uncharacterized membrane protein
MKPEASSASEKLKVESGKVKDKPEQGGARVDEVEQSGKEEDLELTDEEKLVMNLLKDNSPMDLNDLKGQTGLSNKTWDTAIKGLRKHNLAKVEKTDTGLFVSLI